MAKQPTQVEVTPRHVSLVALPDASVSTLFGIFEPHNGPMEFIRHVGLIWLVIGVGGLIFRTVHLFFIKDVQTGLVWATKILTDPFHDVKLYWKAPFALMRGELVDPGIRAHWDEDEEDIEPSLRPTSLAVSIMTL